MCGITGIVGDGGRGASAGMVRGMTAALAHRGPDGEGYYTGPEVSLGHRRLSVIDLETGCQPMTTACGRYTIVFNGEIYNFVELRKELEARGVRFRTRSDTEVLLEAYAAWGREALGKLRGMFALAVWDARERRLFAARDRLGVKPFYYAAPARGGVAFASEIKGLLAHPGVERRLDCAALDDFLTYLYVPAPRTIFQGIRELPPAHWLEWQDGRLRIERYWDVRFRPEERPRAEFLEELLPILESAVGIRLASDVPLGVFLSGGLDSGAIAALAARRLAEPLRTFTLGFPENGGPYNEWESARATAAAIGAAARELTVPARSAELLAAVTRHFDEPFGNPTSLLLYQLSEAGRRHFTVALAGDGGDEVFLGYPRYQGVLLAEQYRKAPAALRRVLARAACHLSEPGNGNHFRRRLREFLTGACRPPAEMYFDWVTYFGREPGAQRSGFGLRHRLYSADLRREIAGHDSSRFLMDLLQPLDGASFLDSVIYADLHSFLPYNLLRYSDRMSMAHGLEIRCPFTDHKLVEFLARVPWKHKLSGAGGGRRTKLLLRQAAAGLLPERVLRGGKRGLNPPMGAWLRGELRPLLNEYLAAERIASRGCFNPETVNQLIGDHLSGRRDYSLHLWALISFEQWHRQYLDSNVAGAAIPAREPEALCAPASRT